MLITEILITNFRSIKNLAWSAKPTTVICGVNSCGKSNVLRALKFAFLQSYDAIKVGENICNAIHGGNAEIRIKLSFNKPTPLIAAALNIPPGTPFTYEIKVKRNATFKTYINGTAITPSVRKSFLSEILIIYVPPLRDIAADGLAPFRRALAEALSKMKGSKSFNAHATTLKNVVRAKSKSLLSTTQDLSANQLGVDELVVDTDALDFKTLVPNVGIKFKINGVEASLDRLGTGHQSAVVLELYRQLGETTKTFTIYLFEEPDNHLHPTSLRAVAADLMKCSKGDNSQVFLTTHSPSLLNQFPVENYLALISDTNRLTARLKQNKPRGDREMRDAFGRFGVTPAEALLSKKVLIVEGPNDVTLFRTLVELNTSCTADRQDVLIVSAGGKSQVSELSALLNELGTTWGAAFDWDASIDTRHPSFKKGLSNQSKTTLTAALNQINSNLAPVSIKKKSAAQKTIQNLLIELAAPSVAHAIDFRHSELGKFMLKVHKLTQPQLATVEAAINSKKARHYRPTLDALNSWIWSNSPEEILLKHNMSEGLVEQEMIADPQCPTNSVIAPGPTKRPTIINYLHGLANRPEQMILIIKKLFAAGYLNQKEIKEATSFATR